MNFKEFEAEYAQLGKGLKTKDIDKFNRGLIKRHEDVSFLKAFPLEKFSLLSFTCNQPIAQPHHPVALNDQSYVAFLSLLMLAHAKNFGFLQISS